MAHARIVRDVTIGTTSLETRVDQSRRGEAAFFEQLGAVRREVAYGKWREALPEPAPVLAMVIEDLGVSRAAKRWRMRNSRAKKLLGEALDLWRDMLDDAYRAIREADLLAARAGLL